MKILTVSQINFYIKSLIDSSAPLANIYVSGEISNFKHYPSGHMYFTIKDEKAQLKCVMFSSSNTHLKFKPENGMKVVCFGRVSVYERDGLYQLYVRDMQPQGIGSLTIAYEQLKEKLENEGLFNSAHKKTLPKYPGRIGVVTSNMGAAVEDIKNIISRRYPVCEIIIVPTVVQGDSAGADIASSIRLLDNMGNIDIIIVGRGGGSLEDLWAFNTEVVARAVYDCKTPIISAVGHETDYTICDFAADLRAPTPSAAAELAVPNIEDEKIKISNYSLTLDSYINGRLEKEEQFFKYIKNNSILSDSDKFYNNFQNKIDDKKILLSKTMFDFIEKREKDFKQKVSMLSVLSPLSVLSRGYSIIKKDDYVIKRADSLSIDDDIEIYLSNGTARAKVSEVYKNE